MTACECDGPKDSERWFWCSRHKCEKTAGWREKCRTNVRYFQAWEEGRGPGQTGGRKQTRSRRPSFVRRVRTYLTAITRWTLAGWPHRTTEEIERIYHLCENCSHFRNEGCAACGCKLGRTRKGLRNKIAMATEGCPRGMWYPSKRLPITTRHLLYHVYPGKANELWRRNVEALTKHWDAFNGRKFVAVALGEEAEPLGVVQEAFGKDDIDWLPIDNDPRLREVAGFRLLLSSVRSNLPSEASFFAHSKGNTTESNPPGAARWRNAMLYHLLGRHEECMEALRRHSCVGTTMMAFARYTKFRFPSGLRYGNWMFSGTFFWFRHDAVFNRPGWARVPDDRYGAESWLGGLFPREEAYSIFQPWPPDQWPHNSPYALEHYPEEFDD